MSQIELLRRRRFAPFFWTQFLGALNDNVFKNALVILLAFGAASGGARRRHAREPRRRRLHPAVLPVLGDGGQLADQYEKSRLIRCGEAARDRDHGASAPSASCSGA